MVLSEFCDKWVGVPFKHGGRGIDGVDCYGLVIEYLKEFNITVPDFEYADKWAKEGYNLFSENIDRFPKLFEKVERCSTGDLIFLEGINNIIDHIGIVVGNNKFIHSIKGIGVAISELSGAYKRKLHGFYRIKHGTKDNQSNS